MSEDSEYQLGADEIGKAIKQYGGLYEEKPELNAYMSTKLAQIASVSERPDKPFEFNMVDSPIINAFALPGYITFSRGIMPYFNNEAEMMAVMGHEVGHITARHTVRQQSAGILTSVGLIAAQVAVSSQVETQAQFDAFNQVASLGANIGMSSYGRNHESEADKLGLRYIAALGYDVTQAANTFDTLYHYRELTKKIYAAAGEPVQEDLLGHLLASHPDPDRRAAVLRELAAENTSGGTKVNKIDFLQKLDGIAFGNDPKDGVYGKTRYYDSTYRLTYDLPPYWFFPAEKGLPEAIHPASGAKLTAGPVSVKSGETAKETLLYKATGVTNVTKVDNPEFDIYMGEIRAKASVMAGRDTDRYAMVAAARPLGEVSDKAKDKTIIFEISVKDPALLGTAGQDLYPILKSLNFLKKDEADKLQPLRVKLRAVKKGETVASLSQELPFAAFHEDQFRMLNGLYNGAEVHEGQLIKMIVDPNKKGSL